MQARVGQTCYCVTVSSGGKHKPEKVLISERSSRDVACVKRQYEDGTISPIRRFVRWKELFATKTEAQKRSDDLNELYGVFSLHPLVSPEVLERNKDILLHVEKEISDRLSDYPNFGGIWWQHLGNDEFKIATMHKQIPEYRYPTPTFINVNNKETIETVIQRVVSKWKTFDVPEEIQTFKDFIADGKKYGWG